MKGHLVCRQCIDTFIDGAHVGLKGLCDLCITGHQPALVAGSPPLQNEPGLMLTEACHLTGSGQLGKPAALQDFNLAQLLYIPRVLLLMLLVVKLERAAGAALLQCLVYDLCCLATGLQAAIESPARPEVDLNTHMYTIGGDEKASYSKT